MEKHKITLSIVVPTLNSEKTLDQCLKAINKSKSKSYELIIIDNNSSDSTLYIAKRYTRNIIKHRINVGKTESRFEGFMKSNGNIIVNIDSDVIIKTTTLRSLLDIFNTHPHIDAITGRLSTYNPYNNFSSQYKSLYMNYYFGLLPKYVNFLYGSLFAIRSSVIKDLQKSNSFTEDTDLGQQMVAQRKKILFAKEILVDHYKKYTVKSLLKNDFSIPYHWAKIFIHYNGIKQLGKNSTGFAHASKNQIISLLLSPISVVFLLYGVTQSHYELFILLFFLWFCLNFKFFWFIYNKRKIFFSLKAILFTYFDHTIMMLGVIAGGASYFFSILKNAKPD